MTDKVKEPKRQRKARQARELAEAVSSDRMKRKQDKSYRLKRKINVFNEIKPAKVISLTEYNIRLAMLFTPVAKYNGPTVRWTDCSLVLIKIILAKTLWQTTLFSRLKTK